MALLELGKDADPGIKAKLRLALPHLMQKGRELHSNSTPYMI